MHQGFPEFSKMDVDNRWIGKAMKKNNFR